MISEKGAVVFDNAADTAELGNHLDRSEIRAALAKGKGSSIRRSSTINQRALYYAVQLKDGSVLRTARNTHSFYSIFLHALPVVILFSAIMHIVEIHHARLEVDSDLGVGTEVRVIFPEDDVDSINALKQDL